MKKQIFLFLLVFLAVGVNAQQINRVFLETNNRPDTVRRLDLSGWKLTTIPNEVFRFKNVEVLILDNNQISQGLEKLSELKKLQRLSLVNNNLTEELLNFAKNTSILFLNLQKNQLKKIPKKVRKLRSLQSLWLGNNPMSHFGKSRFRGLKKLEELNLYNAKIESIPGSIRHLRNIKVIDLYYNELWALPEAIGKLKNLSVLALSHNHVGVLPLSLHNHPKIRFLYAHHNRLSELPILPNLQHLDVGYNHFGEFPPTLIEAPNLSEIDISNNQIKQIPTSFMQMGSLKRVYLSNNDFLKISNWKTLRQELAKKEVEIFD